jgi:hypothetical protein
VEYALAAIAVEVESSIMVDDSIIEDESFWESFMGEAVYMGW